MIIRVLMSGGEKHRWGNLRDGSNETQPNVALLAGLQAKEYRRSPEAEDDKKTDSLLDPPGGMQPCLHLHLTQ